MCAWSGGTYTKGNNSTGGWTGDASLGIGIEAGRHDTQDDDFATGINACLTKDGTNSPSANLPMGGYKHTGVADATAGDEYLSYKQLLGASSAVLSGGTLPNYTVTLTPAPTAYTQGMSFAIILHTSNTSAGATINVNGLGAKDIKVTTEGSTRRDPYPYELSARQVYILTYEAALDSFQVTNPTFGAIGIPFTTTIGAPSGTPSISSQTCNYTMINGRMVYFTIDATCGLAGATAAYLDFTLPKTSDAISIGSRFEGSIAGLTGYASFAANAFITSSTTARIYRADTAAFPIDTGFFIRMTGVYQGASL